MNKKICVITTTRADYGLLSPLMDLIKSDPTLELQIIAAGSHFSAALGMTYEAIEQDGFTINKKVKHFSSIDSASGVSQSTGRALIGFAESLEDLQPDVVVILGDRYEILAAATAALLAAIPIVHLHGGEITEGAFDNSIRHAITKLASLHFASTEEYRHRIIQMGEDPDTVHNVGAIGIENIRNLKTVEKKDLEKDLGISFDKDLILFTFHPETLAALSVEEQCANALNVLKDWKGGFILFTKANADTGGTVVNRMLEEFVAEYPQKSVVYASLGQLRYLSVMKYASLVMGNSSSGIIEVPSFGVPTLNIGDRQKGRVRAESILDCENTPEAISAGLTRALSSEFRKIARESVNPYDKKGTADNIWKILKSHLAAGISVEKQFYNIDF